jgi:hypothetical protein
MRVFARASVHSVSGATIRARTELVRSCWEHQQIRILRTSADIQVLNNVELAFQSKLPQSIRKQPMSLYELIGCINCGPVLLVPLPRHLLTFGCMERRNAASQGFNEKFREVNIGCARSRGRFGIEFDGDAFRHARIRFRPQTIAESDWTDHHWNCSFRPSADRTVVDVTGYELTGLMDRGKEPRQPQPARPGP